MNIKPIIKNNIFIVLAVTIGIVILLAAISPPIFWQTFLLTCIIMAGFLLFIYSRNWWHKLAGLAVFFAIVLFLLITIFAGFSRSL